MTTLISRDFYLFRYKRRRINKHFKYKRVKKVPLYITTGSRQDPELYKILT